MRIRLDTARGPAVELIDARADRLDERGLRTRARAAGHGGSFTSRSYCHPYALVAWHTDHVGVDLERIVACDATFAASIRTPAERAAARRAVTAPPDASAIAIDAGASTVTAHAGDEDVISLWCSKEALAKALGDARRYDPRRLESPRTWAGGACGPWRARSMSVADGYCAWVCWRDPGAHNPR